MATYSASLGVCARRPSGAVRPALWRRAALVAAAFAVGGISLAVLWPRNAAAASIQRIGAAIRHADSMVEEYWRRTPAGRWIMFDRISYRAGMWRYDVQKSVPLALTLIKRDGLTMTDWHQLDHASVRATEASDPDTKEYRDPLDYAEESINMGGSSPRSVQVLNHAPVEGRPAYAVTLDRAADDYHAEIVVDQATDLPISATASVKDPGQTLYYRQSYLFNVPIADSQ
ncbi:MAG TPA: hypothetical protein VKT78_20680, partial [Fimbriimonadaceae bacterium]|nr:hypothetical protein [Fimbriimonadaceae bacterium]